jgi:hypothetical protein
MQTVFVFVSSSTVSTATCHIRLHTNVPALLLLTVQIVNMASHFCQALVNMLYKEIHCLIFACSVVCL